MQAMRLFYGAQSSDKNEASTQVDGVYLFKIEKKLHQ